jgi:CBS domain-containing protein
MSNNSGGARYRFLECTASQYMTPAVETVTRQVTLRDLEALFEKHDFNAFPVVEAGRLLGIVTKFDFLRAFAFTTSQIVPHFDELMRRTVADVMTEAVVHVEPAAPLTRVLQLMVGLKSRSFPVIDSDGQLVGIISREDVMRALKETTREAQRS